MNHHPQLAGIGASISLPAAAISWMATELPVVQFICAAVSIIAGALSIYSWFKNRA